MIELATLWFGSGILGVIIALYRWFGPGKRVNELKTNWDYMFVCILCGPTFLYYALKEPK